MRLPVRHLLAAAAFLLFPTAAWTATITAGSHSLLPSAPGQLINVLVTGGDAVEGLNFRLVVADGFPDLTGSTIDGPNITSVDIIGTGTVFSNTLTDTNNNTGQQDANVPQAWDASTTTASGTVSAEGVLARVILDTTGFTSGTWALVLDNPELTETNFAGISATLVNGSITIIPEPTSLALAAMGAAMLLVISRYRRA